MQNGTAAVCSIYVQETPGLNPGKELSWTKILHGFPQPHFHSGKYCSH